MREPIKSLGHGQSSGRYSDMVSTYALVLPSVPLEVVQVQAPVQAVKSQPAHCEVRAGPSPCWEFYNDDMCNSTLTIAFNVDNLLGTRGPDAIDGSLVQRDNQFSGHGVVSVSARSA